MVLLIILILTEVLTPVVFRQHFFKLSRVRYYIILIIHVILSMWMWILFFEYISHNSFYDLPDHIWNQLNMAGMIIAVIFPRLLLIIMHFTGVLARRRKDGTHIRWLTNTGLIISMVIFVIIAGGTLFGRFNVKTENVTIKVKGLHHDLDGLKIVQISDLHLSGFHHHREFIRNVVKKVNEYKPDIIINTGDFVTFGWREFGRFDTIFAKSASTYGNFAIMGNHDFGTYDPDYTEADRHNNELNMNRLIRASGYRVLNDEHTILKIGAASLAMIGVVTKGRFPDIIYGDLNKAVAGTDSADLKILLTHDPNQWEKEVTGKTDIDITFSGHTHGMQMGILTKKFRWSPAKYFYPHWNGLYTEGEQSQYVNRGLGVLAIPFRIWMPPEITVIKLSSK